MAFNYTPKTWKNGPTGGTPITADELTRIDTGVKLAGDIAYPAGTTLDVDACIIGEQPYFDGDRLPATLPE